MECKYVLSTICPTRRSIIDGTGSPASFAGAAPLPPAFFSFFSALPSARGPFAFGVFSFLAGVSPLYTYLQQQNQKATHFMIGSNILANWQTFLTAYQTLGDDIAVHTWTHPYMTTQSNEQLLGELGWTMQIIHDMTGGKLPAYWRPPYGDIDTRVDAIAQHVFGMTAIVWNQE